MHKYIKKIYEYKITYLKKLVCVLAQVHKINMYEGAVSVCLSIFRTTQHVSEILYSR